MGSGIAARAVARRPGAPLALKLSPPEGAHGVWHATSSDTARPLARFDLLFDAYSGTLLYRSGWSEATAFGQATALGIPFHRGEFGLWNQLLLLLFGLGVLFSLVSGWVMYFKRMRPAGLGLPALLPGAWRAASPLALLTAAGLCALMPLLALSGAILLVLEVLLFKGGRRADLPA
nr:PepSY domain-containing protein [Massilia sp. Dwa41.01b]